MRAVERAEQVGQQAGETETDEHQRDRELLGGMGRRARWCEHAGAEHPEHDRRHREVLVFPGMLAQHPLGGEHQHQQAEGQRWLHHHQRSQQQRHHLQRPAEDREPGADQPARAPEQLPHQAEAQILGVRGLPRIQRLERDP
jgi:hypothetical protein